MQKADISEMLSYLQKIKNHVLQYYHFSNKIYICVDYIQLYGKQFKLIMNFKFLLDILFKFHRQSADTR